MLYNQNNLAVAKIASKSELKPALAGVLFTKDKTVATDGYRLIEMSVPKDVAPVDFPMVDETSALRDCEPFIVNAKAVAEIKVPKGKAVKRLSILENVAVKSVGKDSVELYTTDLEVANVRKMHRMNEQFPAYESVFPEGEPVAEVMVNAEYLAEVAGILAKLGAYSEVKMKFYGTDKPVVLEASNASQQGRAMVMPMRK